MVSVFIRNRNYGLRHIYFIFRYLDPCGILKWVPALCPMFLMELQPDTSRPAVLCREGWISNKEQQVMLPCVSASVKLPLMEVEV